MNKGRCLTSLVLGLGLLVGCGVTGGFLRDSISSQHFDFKKVVMNLREDHAIRSFVVYRSHSLTISRDVLQLSPTTPLAPKVSSMSLSQ